jgi:hypothetical protein
MSDSSPGEGWWLASDGKWYPPEQAVPTAEPPPAARSPRSWSTVHVTLVAAVSLVVGALLGVGLTSSDDDGGSDTASSAQEREPEEEADDEAAAEGDEEEEPPPTTEGVEERELQVTSGMTSGVDSIGTRYTSAGALVTNPNEGLAAYDVQVLFNLMDGAGTVLDTDSTTIPYLPPGATVPAVPLQIGFDLATEPASIEVLVNGDLREDEGWDGVEFAIGAGIDLEVAGAAITPGSFGSELTAQVTNPSPDLAAELATWDCVFTSGGTIVGGETSGISDNIPPGATVSLNHPLTLEVAADEVICRAAA